MSGQILAIVITLPILHPQGDGGLKTWLPVLGLIPGIFAVALALLDRLGKRGRYHDAKVGLELLKLKYEIEGLRKSQQLNLPEITVAAEELEILRPPQVHVGWFDPRKLRNSFWFRLVKTRPRFGAACASLVSVLAGFYGVASFAGILALFDPSVQGEFGNTGFVVGMGCVYAVLGAALLGVSVRIHRARKLALEEWRLENTRQ